MLEGGKEHAEPNESDLWLTQTEKLDEKKKLYDVKILGPKRAYWQREEERTDSVGEQESESRKKEKK